MRLALGQAHLLLQKKDNHHSTAGRRSKVSHESQPAQAMHPLCSTPYAGCLHDLRDLSQFNTTTFLCQEFFAENFPN